MLNISLIAPRILHETSVVGPIAIMGLVFWVGLVGLVWRRGAGVSGEQSCCKMSLKPDHNANTIRTSDGKGGGSKVCRGRKLLILRKRGRTIRTQQAHSM